MGDGWSRSEEAEEIRGDMEKIREENERKIR
jgi:hypothetical protein